MRSLDFSGGQFGQFGWGNWLLFFLSKAGGGSEFVTLCLSLYCFNNNLISSKKFFFFL